MRRSITRLPAPVAIRLYSAGRRRFLADFSARPPKQVITPAPSLARTLWGLEFRSPVFNAAGMFKNGEGHELITAQGAGAYLAGTTTFSPRQGNRKNGVATPFVPYPRSGAASNWLGLPNPGHHTVAKQLTKLHRVPGCPIGVSLGVDPKPGAVSALDGLIGGLEAYAEAGVDFIEFNESCPNTEADVETGDPAFEALAERLEQVSLRFLRHRQRRLPVLVKLSTDTDPARMPELVDLLIGLDFDGLVLGNTSIAYDRLKGELHRQDRRLLDRFVRDFGGGLSGRPLRPYSLNLVKQAANHLARQHPEADFHLVRVGGVESAADVAESLEAGASLVQWYTGYFEAFARSGHRLYAELYAELQKKLR